MRTHPVWWLIGFLGGVAGLAAVHLSVVAGALRDYVAGPGELMVEFVTIPATLILYVLAYDKGDSGWGLFPVAVALQWSMIGLISYAVAYRLTTAPTHRKNMGKGRTKAAEPGATDNPEDAQRLREDH